MDAPCQRPQTITIYYEKVDGSAAGLEPHPCAVVHLFRLAYAGLTPAAEECQGYMNGFAALDNSPCLRYVVVKATAGFAVCRLVLNLLLFYSCLDFTQNWGETRNKSFISIGGIKYGRVNYC